MDVRVDAMRSHNHYLALYWFFMELSFTGHGLWGRNLNLHVHPGVNSLTVEDRAILTKISAPPGTKMSTNLFNGAIDHT